MVMDKDVGHFVQTMHTCIGRWESSVRWTISDIFIYIYIPVRFDGKQGHISYERLHT